MEFEEAICVFSSFGIEINDSRDLAKAYRRIALSIHPDKQQSECDIDMVTLNQAWKTLKRDPASAAARLSNKGRKDPYSDHPLHWSHLPSLEPLKELLASTFHLVEKETLSTLDNVIFPEKSHRSREMYFAKESLLVVPHPSGSLCVQDISDAMERGKAVCTRYLIRSPFDTGNADIWNFLFSIGEKETDQRDIKLSELWAWLESLEFEKNRFESYNTIKFDYNDSNIEVCKSDVKAANVFSPYKLDKLKPLKKVPEKPTRSHLIKALANGQYRNLKVVMRLSDDYAFDSASDFGRGMIGNPFSLVEDMVEHGGTRVYSRGRKDGVVEWSFGNHSNDHKSVEFVLGNDFPKESLVDEYEQLTETKKIA